MISQLEFSRMGTVFLIVALVMLLGCEKALAAADTGGQSSNWLSSWFGNGDADKAKLDAEKPVATSPAQAENGGEMKVPGAGRGIRKSRSSFLKSKMGSKRQYLDVDPYVGDDEVSLYEQKRVERARRLIEQDFADTDYDGSGGPGGGGRQRRSRAEVDFDELDGQRRKGSARGIRGLPDIALRMDPIINFKLKQRITYFGTCVTLGMDYLSDLAQWRAYCGIEDTFLQGRFSLKGKELSWAKSWLVNLGMGEESTAKFKLRLGLNLNNYQAYARLRFRTEPISSFDIGEGLTCAGKVPLPGLLPLLRTVPLRVEYRVRVNTPTQKGASPVQQRRTAFGWGKKDGDDSDVVSLSTGIDTVEVSLDELNFCLEWDEKSPVWDIGLVRTGDRLRGVFGTQSAKPVSVSPSFGMDDDETRGYRSGGLFGRGKQMPPSGGNGGDKDTDRGRGRGGGGQSQSRGGRSRRGGVAEPGSSSGSGNGSGSGSGDGGGSGAGQREGQTWRGSFPPYRHYSAWPSLSGFSDGP